MIWLLWSEKRNGVCWVPHIIEPDKSFSHFFSHGGKIRRKSAAGKCENWKSPSTRNRETGPGLEIRGVRKWIRELFSTTPVFYGFRSQDDKWARNGLLFRTISPKLNIARFPGLDAGKWMGKQCPRKYLAKTCFIAHQWASSIDFLLPPKLQARRKERKKVLLKLGKRSRLQFQSFLPRLLESPTVIEKSEIHT